MRRTALWIALITPLPALMLFCGGPPVQPLEAPGTPVAESAEASAPVSTPAATPVPEAGADEGHEAGTSDALAPVDAATLDDGDIPIGPTDGGLSSDQIKQVVVAHRDALHACYEGEAKKNPTFRGTVTIAWATDASGAVTSAKIAASTLHNPRAETCIVHEIRKWHFPSSSGASQGSFPLSIGVGR